MFLKAFGLDGGNIFFAFSSPKDALKLQSEQGQEVAEGSVYTATRRDTKKHYRRIAVIFQPSTVLTTCLKSYHVQWGVNDFLGLKSALLFL